MAKLDYLIVGAGFFGSVFAREMSKRGKKCLIIDKRDHVGGNCYTELRRSIPVHKYGPHIFHTKNRKIWDFINQFAEFNNFVNSPKVVYKNRVFSFPINLMTMHQLWGVKTPAEAHAKIRAARQPIPNPKNLEEWCLSKIGKELYEIFIKEYTLKQWMTDPKLLPSDYVKRLPIRFVFNENYYSDRFQGMPVGGYTPVFEKLLKGIPVSLNNDYFKNRAKWEAAARCVVFTGRLDEYYSYRFGGLEYRALAFKEELLRGDFQGNAVVNYPERRYPFTRIVEHKHFESLDLAHTVITREYPEPWKIEKEPYYPVNTAVNMRIYRKYLRLAAKERKVIFGGRLAEYKYYDMDQVIGKSLDLAEKILNKGGISGNVSICK